MSSTTVITNPSLMTLSGNLEPWYNMEESIGERLCSLGPWYSCWEAVGRAGDISKGVVFTEIKKLLESRHEDLHEGESVHHAITIGVYMIGRTQKRAKPHIMFSCERKSPRTRAVKMVRESEILKDHPGVLLGECQRPPSLSRSPIPLAGQNPIKNLQADHIELDHQSRSLSSSPPLVPLISQPSEQRPRVLPNKSLEDGLVDDVEHLPTSIHWKASHQIVGASGIPISIMKEEFGVKTRLREATMGGFVRVGDEILGLTVAHAFRNPTEVIESDCLEDMEFSFEYDSNSEEEDEDASLVSITSRGSNSPKQSDSDHSGTSISTTTTATTRESSNQPSSGAFHIERDMGISEPTFHPPVLKDIENEGKEQMGQLLALSNADRIANLDWALIRLSNPMLFTKTTEMKFPSNQVESESIGMLATEPVKSKVAVLTGSNGVLQGSMSGNVTLMQFPPSRAFQEVWTVHIKGPLKPGDCGAWVVDATTGALYGHIVAGDPAVSIAYITPACQIFSDIEECLGDKVVLPSSRRLLPERLLSSGQQSNLSKNILSTLPSHDKNKGFKQQPVNDPHSPTNHHSMSSMWTKRSNHSKRFSKASTSWSDWYWSATDQCFERYRYDSKGVKRYEQRTDDSTPRDRETDLPPLDTIAESSSQQNYQPGNFEYISDPIGDITQGIADTSLDTNSSKYLATGREFGTSTGYPNYPNASGSATRTIRTQNPATNVDPLDKDFTVHRSREFKFGKVFKILWSEPTGSAGTQLTGRHTTAIDKPYHSIRRFVVVDDRNSGHSLCLPILTYGGKGVQKSGSDAGDHAVIYTSKETGPLLMRGENITKASIRMKPNNAREKLDPASRLNYAKVYTVEHNVKVKFIGEIVPEHQQQLVADYNNAHPPISNPSWAESVPESTYEGTQRVEPKYIGYPKLETFFYPISLTSGQPEVAYTGASMSNEQSRSSHRYTSRPSYQQRESADLNVYNDKDEEEESELLLKV